MPASEPDVGSCTGSAAIELLLSLGEAVEDDGFRRVGTVGKEFRKLLALIGPNPPSTQFTVLSWAWAPRCA